VSPDTRQLPHPCLQVQVKLFDSLGALVLFWC
jgi:hypothetical protein